MLDLPICLTDRLFVARASDAIYGACRPIFMILKLDLGMTRHTRTLLGSEKTGESSEQRKKEKDIEVE